MSHRAELKLNIALLVLSILGIIVGSFCIHLASAIGDSVFRNWFIAGVGVSIIGVIMSIWNILILTYTIKTRGEYY